MAETISVIVTVLNGAKWIEHCFESIAQQTAVLQQQQQQHRGVERAQLQNPLLLSRATTTEKITSSTNYCVAIALEVCVFDDFSRDETPDLLLLWQRKFEGVGVRMRIVRNESGKPKGVGYGRNRAIAVASGDYLCFQDIDDEMLPARILQQYQLARVYKNALIGAQFVRLPANSTCRFSRWANELGVEKLDVQIYTANGPTVIMPTWFCHRDVYEKVNGGFSEAGHGTPEDLIFFYAHLEGGGEILRVDDCLLKYRYHPEATTFSIAEATIWCIRMQHLLKHVLYKEPWSRGFSIWNAGKQGRRFFRHLPLAVKEKVVAFCDVDKNKIQHFYNYYDETRRKVTHSIPIVHFSQAQPPLLICMKLDLTNGAFEANLKSLHLSEGKDYVLFT